LKKRRIKRMRTRRIEGKGEKRGRGGRAQWIPKEAEGQLEREA